MIKAKKETIPNDVLEELITLGEGYKTEFKESLPSPEAIARTICAFSNAKGGNIFVGLTRNGIPVGIINEEEELYKIEKSLEIIIPKPNILVSIVKFKNTNLMLVNIKEGSKKPYYIKNGNNLKSYIRVGDLNVQASKKAIKRFANNNISYGNKRLKKEEKILLDIFSQNKKLNFNEISEILNFKERKIKKIIRNLCKRGFIIQSDDGSTYYYNEIRM